MLKLITSNSFGVYWCPATFGLGDALSLMSFALNCIRNISDHSNRLGYQLRYRPWHRPFTKVNLAPPFPSAKMVSRFKDAMALEYAVENLNTRTLIDIWVKNALRKCIPLYGYLRTSFSTVTLFSSNRRFFNEIVACI